MCDVAHNRAIGRNGFTASAHSKCSAPRPCFQQSAIADQRARSSARAVLATHGRKYAPMSYATYMTEHYSTSYHIVCQGIALHYITSQYITLHYTTLQ